MKAIGARVLDSTHLELSQPLTETMRGRIEILIPGPDEKPRTRPRSRRTGVEVGSPSKEGKKKGPKAVAGRRLREREDAWCRSHPEVLRRYAGQWVVVEGKEIIAHGQDPYDPAPSSRSW